VADDPLKSEYLNPPTFLSGGGGLVSTAEDYRRFCQMLLDGGRSEGGQIVSRKTIELMTQNHLPDNSDLAALATGTFSESTFDGVGFGLGFAVLIDAAKRGLHGSEGEFYWGGAASTAFWVDPTGDLLVVFLAQLMPSNTYDFRGQLRNPVYSAIVD
jgi:CubicO group peptidase (beta-lactamase class C family)